MNIINSPSLEGKRVLIRVDFNVPLDGDLRISDDSRMVAALPTINKIIKNNGKAIIMSHLGRPKNCFERKFSLKNIVKHLSGLLRADVEFSADCIGPKAYKRVQNLKNGGVLVLENLRFYSEEKSGNKHFAKELAKLGDIYINDAFGTAHRAHASTSVIAQFFPKNKYLGSLFLAEMHALDRVLSAPKRPLTAIIGGSKISGKINIIKSLIDTVDVLIIGGGMAYTFAKALGGKVGKSLVEDEKITLAKTLLNEAKNKGVEFLLPTDSINADQFSNKAAINNSPICSIDEKYMGLDIGDESVLMFSEKILCSKTIVWNGPMGVFEMSNFESGTKRLASAICLATQKGAFSLVGGGDSVAAIKKFNLEGCVSYVSTGGGAMLEYLEGKKLPAISAILD